ncbi:MAG: hypothetical protein JO010_08405 [Alphaproteobacteria bacterium]|nr:hypothetical protein [Alphaproteobacteria bacterium]
MMIARALRSALPLLLIGAATGCATVGAVKDDPFAAAVERLPRFPACDAEINALVALVRLARQLGSDWQVYEPALEVMQDQVIDCVQDSYPNPIGI